MLHKHEDDWSLESLVDAGECGGPHATPASEEDTQNKLTREAESLMSFLAVIRSSTREELGEKEFICLQIPGNSLSLRDIKWQELERAGCITTIVKNGERVDTYVLLSCLLVLGSVSSLVHSLEALT